LPGFVDRPIRRSRLTGPGRTVFLSDWAICCPHNPEDSTMAWTAPKIVEVALGGEINCYACARVK